MNKKVLSLVLSLVMVLGTFTTVFAAEKTDDKKVEKIVGKDNKIQYIIDKKFVEGYGNGDFGYDKNIKRSEITKLLVYANGNKELAEKLQGAMKLYSDVETSFWANGVITVGSTVPSEANGQAMLNGYPDRTFKPANNVSYAELSKMLVVLVKADLTADMVKDANAHWASQWLTWAAQLGILDDVTVANSNAPATRADAFTMVYNALYKMKEFKREASNAKLGIISNLNSNKIVLNQDDKQEYKISDSTVFVRNAGNGFAYEVDGYTNNVLKVKAVKNPEFYLGSLVRVLVNDKNEVTHILELGNPRHLALSEARWNGVADKAISTPYTNIGTLKDLNKVTVNGYVKVLLNKDQTKFNKIEFWSKDFDGDKMYYNDAKLVKTLDVNSDTKVFVANPANNIMREVKNIDEAISLIGYGSHRDMIPNVYAGYDTNNGYKGVINGYNTADDMDAKVIVFNVVNKDKWGADLYRVLADTDSRGYAVLENTDGKKFDRDFFKSVAAFPFNYGDKYDVIDVSRSNFVNEDIVKKLDHSETNTYPIVKVVDMYNDKKVLVVRDKYNDEAIVKVGDADIFNKSQYKDLRRGDVIQLCMNKDKVNADIVSILPNDMKLAGAIAAVANGIQEGTHVAKFVKAEYNNSTAYATVELRVYRNNYDGDEMTRVLSFTVDKKVAMELEKNQAMYGSDYTYKFLVRDLDGQAGKYFAYNFEPNNYTQEELDKMAADKAEADKKAEKEKAEKEAQAQFDAYVAEAKKTEVADQDNTATTTTLQSETDTAVKAKVSSLDKDKITNVTITVEEPETITIGGDNKVTVKISTDNENVKNNEVTFTVNVKVNK